MQPVFSLCQRQTIIVQTSKTWLNICLFWLAVFVDNLWVAVYFDKGQHTKGKNTYAQCGNKILLWVLGGCTRWVHSDSVHLYLFASRKRNLRQPATAATASCWLNNFASSRRLCVFDCTSCHVLLCPPPLAVVHDRLFACASTPFLIPLTVNILNTNKNLHDFHVSFWKQQ